MGGGCVIVRRLVIAYVTIVVIIWVCLMSTWKVADAKARFSELVEKALAEGAQEVTRHGKRTVVVVSAEDWDRKTKPRESLVEFFEKSPLKGSDLRIERLRDQPRDIEL